MIFEEFKDIKQVIDNDNPFSNLYELDDGALFYIEPAFHTQMLGFKERVKPEEYLLIVDSIIKTARKNKKVIYTSSFEYPQTLKDGFIYLEITDITDPLKLFVEDKSRGSDYGD